MKFIIEEHENPRVVFSNLLKDIPIEFFCNKCGFLIVDKKVDEFANATGLYDICECKEPKFSKDLIFEIDKTID